MSEETFRWVISGGVIIIAVFFAVMGIAALLVSIYVKRLMEKVEPILKAANPIAKDVQEVVAGIKPKILKVSSDAVEVSSLVVTEAKRYSEISKDVAERAKVKIARFDVAVDGTMDQVHGAADAAKTAVRRPFQHLEGVVAGMRTAIHTYAASSRARNSMYGEAQYRPAQDEEMFI